MLTPEELGELATLVLRATMASACCCVLLLLLTSLLCWRSLARPRQGFRRSIALLQGLVLFALGTTTLACIALLGSTRLDSPLLFTAAWAAIVLWQTGRRAQWARGFLAARGCGAFLVAILLLVAIFFAPLPGLSVPWEGAGLSNLLSLLAWALLSCALVHAFGLLWAPEGYSGSDLTAFGPFGARHRRSLATVSRRLFAHAFPLFLLSLSIRLIERVSTGTLELSLPLRLDLSCCLFLAAYFHGRSGRDAKEETESPKPPLRHRIGFHLCLALAFAALSGFVVDFPGLPVLCGGLALAITSLCLLSRFWIRKGPETPLPSGPMKEGLSVLTVPVEGIVLSADDVANAFSLMGFRVRALELERGHVGGRAHKERFHRSLSLMGHVCLVFLLSASLAMYTASRSWSLRLAPGARFSLEVGRGPTPWERLMKTSPCESPSPRGLPLQVQAFSSLWSPARWLPDLDEPIHRLAFTFGLASLSSHVGFALAEGPPILRLSHEGKPLPLDPAASFFVDDILVHPRSIDRCFSFRVSGPDHAPRRYDLPHAGALEPTGFLGRMHFEGTGRTGFRSEESKLVPMKPVVELVVDGAAEGGRERRIRLEPDQSAIVGPWAITFLGMNEHVQLRCLQLPMRSVVLFSALLWLFLLFLRFFVSGYHIDFFVERLPGSQAMLHLRVRTRGLAADRAQLVETIKSRLVTEHESFI